jgi:hypothetical protein
VVDPVADPLEPTEPPALGNFGAKLVEKNDVIVGVSMGPHLLGKPLRREGVVIDRFRGSAAGSSVRRDGIEDRRPDQKDEDEMRGAQSG